MRLNDMTVTMRCLISMFDEIGDVCKLRASCSSSPRPTGGVKAVRGCQIRATQQPMGRCAAAGEPYTYGSHAAAREQASIDPTTKVR